MKLKPLLAVAAILACSACAKSDDMNQAKLSNNTQNIIINKKQCKQMKFLKNYNCSVNNIENKATAGNADAAYALGYIYYYGIGIHENEQSAQLWIERAANLGQPAAIEAKQMLAQAQETNKTVQSQATNNTQIAINQQQTSNIKMIVRHPQPLNQTSHIAKQHDVYVIQLAASKNKEWLAEIQTKYNINNSTITTRRASGTDWYVLQQGNYSSLHNAHSAMHEYPTSVKDLKPWVRKA
jgi:septal ring-binding cell division protein DamX